MKIPPQPDATVLWFSPPERKVMELLRLARQNKEIADELAMSPHTVKRHVSKLLHILALKDRMELQLWCLQHPDEVETGKTRDRRIHRPGCECGSADCAVAQKYLSLDRVA